MNEAVAGANAPHGGDWARRIARDPRWLFTLTIFTGSFLLFMVQPMVARMALPRLGGAPAVWNSAMLVYQALLLAGYGWAHWLGRFTPRTQTLAHLGLFALGLLFLPVGLANFAVPTDGEVIFAVPLLLLASVGPLLIAVSAQAPLMQRWFADTAPAANPYALYAASNLGSFGGLIAYPLLVEPLLRVSAQSIGWSILYLALLALVALCGWVTITAQSSGVSAAARAPIHATPAARSPAPAASRVATWILLSMVPSGLMLSTTTHLTTDITAMPLMWAIPLGLYLLSFTIAFSERRFLADLLTMLAPAMLLLAGGISMFSQGNGGLALAASALLMLLAVAVSLHSRLYELRPASDRLTFFYLMMAVGGVLGGVLCALVAPLLFDWVYEHPILLLAAAMLMPMPPLIPWLDWLRLGEAPRRAIRLLLIAAAIVLGGLLAQAWTGYFSTTEIALAAALLLVGLLSIGMRWPFVVSVAALMFGFGGLVTLQETTHHLRTRSYFGIYTVRDDGTGVRTLAHGTTLHGLQFERPDLARQPTSYYGPTSGVGLAFDRASKLYGPNARLGVVGLGTGTLACYARPGQSFTYFEIDPAMVRIASGDPGGRGFSYLHRCAPQARIALGDARIRLAEAPADSIDLLAIDAFSSDAIPLHLLTREAFEVYDRALSPRGVLLVHISNRFVNLEPVLRALELRHGWHAMLRMDNPDEQDLALRRTASLWVAMSRDARALDDLSAASVTARDGRGHWRELASRPAPVLWTDDYASVMPLLRNPLRRH